MSKEIVRVASERAGLDLAAPQSGGAMTSIEAQDRAAEMQARVFMAKQFPRNQRDAIDRILNDCQIESFAEMASYCYDRGGMEITGPSIRLAECIARAWGNLDYGIIEIERTDKAVLAKAFAWDLETNTRCERTVTVPNVRYTKRGSTELKDPRDIYENTANQMARRLRVCILEIVPMDVVETAMQQCNKTLECKADVTPEGIKKLMAAFERFGVSQQQIERRINRRIDTIRPSQVVHLRKIYASLADGMGKVSDFFEADADVAEDALTEELSKKWNGRVIKANAAPASHQPPAQPSPEKDAQKRSPAETVQSMLDAAETVEAVTAASSQATKFYNEGGQITMEELQAFKSQITAKLKQFA